MSPNAIRPFDLLLLSLTRDVETYAARRGEPERDDDLLADQRRYLERRLNDDTPHPIAQARGRDERH